jgi:Gpi18-like mannosyltransferase
MLAAFYFLHKGRVKTSIFMYGLAILSKPTALFALPIFIFWLLKKSRFSDLLLGFSIFILQVLILYFPFHPNNLIMWVILFYRRSLSGELGYMVANAFNFWALIFGFDNRPDTSLFLGIPANLLGNTVYAVFVLFSFVMLLKRNLKTTSILLMTSILLFSAFMFLPRMHDRYFYPVLIMLIPTAAIDKKIRNIFWFVSTIHLINLYHFWWIPKINILINVLSNKLFENILIMSNIIIFIYLIYTFKKDHAKSN